MKCSTFRKETLDAEQLTPECLAHAQECPDCLALFEQGLALRSLLALRKHERIPGDSLDCACRAFRLAAAESFEPAASGLALVLRYGLAGAFMMLLVINFSISPELPAMHPPEPQVRSVAAAPSPSFPGPFLAHSNAEPSGIQYGPLPSSLVNFNY
ncbi:MAG TPA: hypothetical protein PLT67_10885 [Kiritimatiellia bacterium]|nr:hypothetical protein [Kiritimatiellia bacterium]